MNDINIELLHEVADILQKNPNALMGSKWQNGEIEVIVTQAICSCAYNHKETKDSFSWAGKNLMSDHYCGPKNRSGLNRLINEGSIVMEDYQGDLDAPKTTFFVDNKPQILQVTNELLEYVKEFTS